ncbi:Hypothetical predicted protein [Mytilus galloprovincialis]|uniref:Protein kinase domain-containing protein n=1 Tax=Mytilus galloprovincialis TaxID=29158 RepID=A0A8B6D9K1_MYTGA|nr:Hypothetical predicted protein [Mytilus galloprovincialis]
MSHQNIVKCHGLIPTVSSTVGSSNWYLFLEYMDMGSIKNTYKSFGHIEENFAKYITKEVLKGLAFLHGNGIVHRDIKADNILFNSANEIKIGDFGITKRLYPSNAGEFGLQTKMVGTLTHMAPEIRFSNCPTTLYASSVDIWSLGCTVLEMLTGDDPKIVFTFDNMDTSCCCTYERPRNITNACFQFIQGILSVNPANRPTVDNLIINPQMTFAHVE